MADHWNSAAAYLIAISILPRDVEEEKFLSTVRKWENSSQADVRRSLRDNVGDRVRARNALLENDVVGGAYRWVLEEVELADLFMRGGDHIDGVGDRVWELHQGFQKVRGRRWKVPEATKAMEGEPEARWDSSLRSFMELDLEKVPNFKRTIHTHYEEGTLLTIGDGYHRAVATCRAGLNTIRCWNRRSVE